MTIAEGMLVSLEYTLTNEGGQQLESNVGGEPLQYIHGLQQIIPGLEKALDGLDSGDTKTVTVSPEEGYGQPDPRAVIEAPKTAVPPEALKVDAMLQTMGQDGQPMNARVAEIKEEVVVLDFNHPLAGQVLNFEVKVLEVSPASS